jgi:hypothetical protein
VLPIDLERHGRQPRSSSQRDRSLARPYLCRMAPPYRHIMEDGIGRDRTYPPHASTTTPTIVPTEMSALRNLPTVRPPASWDVSMSPP